MPKTIREVPLSTLATNEQEALIPRLVRDSGRVFRESSTGAAVTKVDAAQVTCPVLCVSAGSDENVAGWTSRRIAKRYGAERQDHPGKPHWIIAESVLDDVAPPVLQWLRRTMVRPTDGSSQDRRIMTTTRPRSHHGAITRSFVGPSATEAFIIIAIATILITRLYLKLTGYPQIGGGDLHIAHALYGGALMMLALVIGWMTLGFGARMTCVVMGGIGFGLFLDEVGKFVTKDNDYFYGPAAEIMYILVVLILVGARIVRDFRPLSGQECLASAASIAADGLARGLATRRREIGLTLTERAKGGGVHADDAERIRELLLSADAASDRLYAAQRRVLALVPNVFRSPRWIPIVGWLILAGSVVAAAFGAFSVATREGPNVPSVILLVAALLTLGIALPAMIARRRTNALWPLHWLRNAALIFTLLNALVDFATEGFGALVNLTIGLFTLAILGYQLDLAARGQPHLGNPGVG